MKFLCLRNCLLLFTLLAFKFSFAGDIANNLFIEGSINSTTQLKEITIRKLGVLKDGETAEFKMPIKDLKFSGSFYIQTFGFYLVSDGWGGHKIFLHPNDSLKITLQVIPDLEEKLKNTYLPTFHLLTTTNIMKGNILFFDILDQKKGVFNLPRYFQTDPKHPTPEFYRKNCDQVRDASISLLNEYKSKEIVTAEFYKYALIEIHCRYISGLCDMLAEIEKEKVPTNYFDEIDRVDFHNNDALYINDNFEQAATIYNYYYLNFKTFDYKNWYSDMASPYNSALTAFDGLLRDKVLAGIIEGYSDKNYEGFDSIYQKFKVDCKDASILTRISKIVVENANKGKFEITKLLPALYSTTVKNKTGKSFVLANLFKNRKYILIDVWATWCGPCMAQKPSFEAYEKKYKDSISFFYLSADSEFDKWQKYIQKKKPLASNQYILDKSLRSEFGLFFEIDYIPRYIFLKNEGKEIFSVMMPLPTMTDRFNEYIHDALK